MVICLERGADLHMFQLMPLPLTVSCFSKIQIGFTFLVPEKWPLNRCVCVCVCDGYKCDHPGRPLTTWMKNVDDDCLRWILGYMMLEIRRKIGLSGDIDVCAQCYALAVVHATVALDRRMEHLYIEAV